MRLNRSEPPLALAAVYQLDSGTDADQVRSDPAAAAAFGINLDSDTVDRATAMTIPSVRRGRQVIAGTLGAAALVGHRANADGTVTDVTGERQLLVQPDPNVTRQWVLTWTVDDLVFHGVSWWRILSTDPEGYPRTAEWISRDRIRVDVGNRSVYIDGKYVPDRKLIRFDGPDEGVLTYGGRSLRTCLLLEEAVRKFAKLDVPLGYLALAEGAPELDTTPGSADPTDPQEKRSQVDALLDAWEEARRFRTTAYMNRAITYDTVQFDAEQTQLPAARAFQSAEMARLLNLAPRWVNAPSGDSMTYSTTAADRADLVDTSLSGYIAAVEQRLSMGDVTPRGTTVRFDLTRFLRGDTKTALETAEIAVRLEAMTSDEVRTDVLGRTPLPTSATPPQEG